jgi:hypothetical protein
MDRLIVHTWVGRECILHIHAHDVCGEILSSMTQCGRCILEFPNRKKKDWHKVLPWLCVFQELSSLRCLLPFSTHTLIDSVSPSSVLLSLNR